MQTKEKTKLPEHYFAETQASEVFGIDSYVMINYVGEDPHGEEKYQQDYFSKDDATYVLQLYKVIAEHKHLAKSKEAVTNYFATEAKKITDGTRRGSPEFCRYRESLEEEINQIYKKIGIYAANPENAYRKIASLVLAMIKYDVGYAVVDFDGD